MKLPSSSVLSGDIAIITGGASGLGLAIAKTLSDAGAKIIVFDFNQESINKLPSYFGTKFVDVTDRFALQEAFDNVIESNGKIDILVNNAGFLYNEPLINITKLDRKHDYDMYKKVIDINMNSVFLSSSIAAEHMILKRTKGVIINISSISSYGNAGQTAYSAAKAGVNAFTKTWAKELGAFGIRVVAISPGFIETESTINNLSTSILDSIVKRIPLKRLGNVCDVANTVLSIVSNDYINGTVIDVNGGMVL